MNRQIVAGLGIFVRHWLRKCEASRWSACRRATAQPPATPRWTKSLHVPMSSSLHGNKLHHQLPFQSIGDSPQHCEGVTFVVGGFQL